MKELKCVKFNVGMYDDIKLKIIDTMKERDLIHYCLARFIVLAGKVNMDGYLCINENMPYTIGAFAIEFNRSIEEIELSIKALIDLEILELTEGKIYKVKNWAKHQNIKKKCDEYSDGYIKKDDNSCEYDEIKDTNNVENILEDVQNITEETINQTVDSNKNLEENNKFNSGKDLLISGDMVNDDLRQESNKVDIKKKRGKRGRPKKSSDNNSKIKNIKKDNSLIQFSCDGYEDDDFNFKDNEFVTFTMG